MKNILYAFLCFFFTSLLVNAQAIKPKTWMSTLPESTLMVDISIPATHDSGAMLGGFSLQTQDASIQAQLETGIRGFDIRLTARPEGKLGVYHDVQYQEITWEDHVLPAMVDFLKKNPTETLWVSLKKEGGDTEEYCKLITASLMNPALDAYIVKQLSPSLTLGECRGKIIFVHRDTYLKEFPGMQCYDWPDNASGAMTFKTQEGTILNGMVQDEYGYKSGKKAAYKAQITWKHMKNAMKNALSDKTWYISFASATAIPVAGPADFAKVVNPYLVKKTKSMGKTCGVVLVDFSGSEAAQQIIVNLVLANQKYFLN